MRQTRARWTSSIARSIAFVALMISCIDATTVYHVPDNGGAAPSGADDSGAPTDDSATGEGSSAYTSNDGGDSTAFDTDAGAEE